MKILIAGIGNKLRCDDGFGPKVIEELAKLQLPSEVDIVDYGTSAFKVLFDLEKYDLVIFVDAIDKEEKPGEVFVIKPYLNKGKEEVLKISLHEVELEKLLKIAKELKVLPSEVVIVGCQPKILSSGLKMSMEVTEAVKKTVEIILNILKEKLKNKLIWRD